MPWVCAIFDGNGFVMRLKLICIGKTDDKQLQTLIATYCKRLQHYIKFEYTELPDLKNTKNLGNDLQKEKEALLVLKTLENTDYVVLLDENGLELDSIKFSQFLQKQMNSGRKRLVFIIGGAYGFGEELRKRGQQQLSLSKMTFSHQMVRLFAVEQLYRAFTILRNEPYHHQ